MTEFDPYHNWLGIPPAEQPPDHYRLLGLARVTNDARSIQSSRWTCGPSWSTPRLLEVGDLLMGWQSDEDSASWQFQTEVVPSQGIYRVRLHYQAGSEAAETQLVLILDGQEYTRSPCEESLRR